MLHFTSMKEFARTLSVLFTLHGVFAGQMIFNALSGVYLGIGHVLAGLVLL